MRNLPAILTVLGLVGLLVIATEQFWVSYLVRLDFTNLGDPYFASISIENKLVVATVSNNGSSSVVAVANPLADVPTVPVNETKLSSSTMQVGPLVATVTCINGSPQTVDISSKNIAMQHFNILSSDVAIDRGCANVIVKDINFDGHPDFLLAVKGSSDGVQFRYWLYSPASNKFYCPNTSDDCSLMNPIFDQDTKTVISLWKPDRIKMSDLYKAVDGNLVLYKHIGSDGAVQEYTVPVSQETNISESLVKSSPDSLDTGKQLAADGNKYTSARGDVVRFVFPLGQMQGNDNPVSNITVNDIVIGSFAGFGVASPSFSPDNDYFAFTTRTNLGGGNEEINLFVINLNVPKFNQININTRPSKKELDAKNVYEVMRIVDSYEWISNDYLKVIQFYRAAVMGLRTYQVISPIKTWGYYLPTGTYTEL